MKLIKLKTDHYIIVDDSEIKEGDWVLQQNYEKTHNQIINIETEFQSKVANDNSGNYFKRKITHSTLALGDSPSFSKYDVLYLSEVKELIGEVDVEKKILDLYNQFPLHPMETMYPLQGATKRFIEFVYNQALEDNKDKKYTENDLRRYHNIMCLHGNKKGGEFIQSFQPKTEWEVEIVDGKLKLK